MTHEKTLLWIEIRWLDERLQVLHFQRPQEIWLAEDGDLVLPQSAIGMPRRLLAVHRQGQWQLADGQPVTQQTLQLGDFTLTLQQIPREKAHLPLAWPQELGRLGLAMVLALGLVLFPLLAGQGEARRKWHAPDPQESSPIVAIEALPWIVGDQQTEPDQPGAEPQTVTHVPREPDRPLPLPPQPEPAPEPQVAKLPPPLPTQGQPVQQPIQLRKGLPRVPEPNAENPLAAIDQLRQPVVARPTLFGNERPGDLERQNGTDNPHQLDALAGRPQRPTMADQPLPPKLGKLNVDRDVDLQPGRQEVVEVKNPQQHVEGNGLDAETVRTYIQRMHGQLSHCAELGMLAGTRLNGRVRMTFTIAADGSVLHARLEESALQQTATEDCFVEKVRNWHFPAAQNGQETQVRHGFLVKVR